MGPLRNAFDDRWPYINVFLAAPGRAAVTVAIVIGLLIAIRRYSKSRMYRFATIGFSLLLFSGLVRSLYSAWAMHNRTDLQKIVFDVPTRMFIWRWFSFVDVPSVIFAIGFSFLVLALASNSSAREAA